MALVLEIIGAVVVLGFLIRMGVRIAAILLLRKVAKELASGERTRPTTIQAITVIPLHIPPAGKDEVQPVLTEMESLGFESIDTYGVDEMPGIALYAFLHPEGIYGIAYQRS